MLHNLREEQIGAALSKAQWRSGFQQLLYKIGLLLVEMNSGGEDGAFLRIADSRIYENYREQGRRLQQWLMESWREEDGNVLAKASTTPSGTSSSMSLSIRAKSVCGHPYLRRCNYRA
jgi:hypothetical protein